MIPLAHIYFNVNNCQAISHVLAGRFHRAPNRLRY
jgi:hypothetical protein